MVAASRVLTFLRMQSHCYPRDFGALDARVCEFIESLWHDGESKSFASDCLSGLGHFIDQCKRFLVGAWRLRCTWSRAELPARARALPFTPLLVYALAQAAFEKGWRDVSVLLLLGFDRFGRSGEFSLLGKATL